MSNIVLSWPNRINEATITSLETWSTSLPLSNLSIAALSDLAKLSATSTTIKFTFSDFTQIGTIALANHNLSTTANIRIYLYYDAAQTTLLYDSGNIAAWQAVYDTLELEWEDVGCWDGLPSDAKRKEFTTLFYHYASSNFGIVSGKIVITDTSNPDGFITIGRLMLSRWFSPTINASYGFERGYKTSTTMSDCNDTRYYRRRKPRRTKALVFDGLNKSEAILQILDAQRSQGIDKEILYSDTIEKDQYTAATSFLGTLADLSPISQPNFTFHGAKINLEEVL